MEVSRFFRENLGILDEILPFNGMELLQVLEQRDTCVVVLLANDLSQRQQDLSTYQFLPTSIRIRLGRAPFRYSEG